MSRGPLLVSEFVWGKKKTRNLFEVLSKARVRAKENGDKRYGRLSESAEALMLNPWNVKGTGLGPEDVPSAGSSEGNSDEES